MNYFTSKISAEKYSAGRPDFHANTINHIKDFLKLDKRLNKVLDIACGTGLSTKALLPIANNVYGTDLSAEMLKVAFEKDKINYRIAPAEQQPFENDEFDLVTVSSGVHWFDIDAFLIEANRLLKTGGWLVIYENFFSGDMDGRDDFKKWVNEVYYKQSFPSPPRNKHYDWSPENLQLKGFTIHSPENFKNAVSFNKIQLINYFLSQSNISAAVESGKTTYDEVEKWLDAELSEFFEDTSIKRTLYFDNWIKYLQMIDR
ncbi:MAG TPA: methyltransferase domain-containing protein [Mucilaginibacter sp.]|jgi:ubiquinone/menaquinone biosynthesis C-methylase UbiE